MIKEIFSFLNVFLEKSHECFFVFLQTSVLLCIPGRLGAGLAAQVDLKFTAFLLSQPLKAGIIGVSYHAQLMNGILNNISFLFVILLLCLILGLGVHLIGSVLA